ncbi:MAG: glycosyltransferase family 39 protein [Patescibacteria group bacterium]|nr:glycosyltransferase family 39 protein [Patescibacteria group bacterium]
MFFSKIKNYKETITVGLILIFSLLTRVYQITEPWIGHHDFNGALWSIIAKNHLNYGYLTTKFAPIINAGPAQPHEFFYYFNHPPLLPILISFSFFLFGEKEWAARIVPIFFSMLSILIFYFLVRKIWGIKIAFISSFFFSFNPMSIYFGRMVNFEPLLVFFVLLFIYFYLLWLEKRGGYLWGMIIIFILGTLIGWPMYYLPLTIVIHYFFCKKNIKDVFKFLFIFFTLALIIFSFYLFYIFYITGSTKEIIQLFSTFLNRTGSLTSQNYQFNILQLTILELYRSFNYFTPPLLILSLIWFFSFLFKIAKNKKSEDDFLVFSLFVFGIITIFLFKLIAWVHDYWLYYNLPAIALSSAMVVKIFEKKYPQIFVLSFIFLTIIFVSFSFKFTKHLYHQGEVFSYFLGKIINLNTDYQSRILYPMEHNPKIAYYAQRMFYWQIDKRSSFLEILEKDKKRKYFLFLNFNQNIVEKELKNDLFLNYSFTELIPNILLFDLNVKKNIPILQQKPL